MNRAEIIVHVSEATGLTRKEVSAVFEGILSSIQTALSKGGTVELRRFGTFRCVLRSPRRAVNPRTGEPVKLGYRVIPTFKPSPMLRDAVSYVKTK